MNRQEATGVLREVLDNCRDFVSMDFVSITDSAFQTRMKSTGYEIYIKCNLCSELRNGLDLILEKHKLKNG
jgi:hypothetical protein